jgi:hypothetical protein
VLADETFSRINMADGRKYFFDHVFASDASQERVYKTVAKPLLMHFLEGFNCTVVAYGQTGSGKTYTMGTDAEGLETQTEAMVGILPRLAHDLFRSLDERKGRGGGVGTESSASDRGGRDGGFQMDVQCQFLEIYNNEIRDLLGPQTGGPNGTNDTKKRMDGVTLRESGSDIIIGGALRCDAPDVHQLMSAFHAGCSCRTTGVPSLPSYHLDACGTARARLHAQRLACSQW